MLFVPERRRSRRQHSAIGARVFAADLQEEPAKRIDMRADSSRQSFRWIRRRRRLSANIAASGASDQTQRALASEAIKLGPWNRCLRYG